MRCAQAYSSQLSTFSFRIGAVSIGLISMVGSARQQALNNTVLRRQGFLFPSTLAAL
jgi:hypothetical protein